MRVESERRGLRVAGLEGIEGCGFGGCSAGLEIGGSNLGCRNQGQRVWRETEGDR